jgi:Xaa-Pro aminopeptidase
MQEQTSRREQLGRLVADHALDGFLVTNPVNVTYLTGFSGDSSYLLVGRERSILVSDGRYEEQIREECPGLEVHIRPPSQRITPAAAEVIAKLGWRQLGFESGHLTVGEMTKLQESLPSVNWKPCEDAVEKFRVVKDATEIAQIRDAIAIAERAFGRWRASLRPDHTEKQLSDRMEMLLREEGARCGSFPTIVGVGARAALPHAPLTAKRVTEGELLLVDWGANGGFYKSDLTRVLAPRRISPKLEQVYGVVLRAQTRAIGKIRPGVKACDVDAEARSALQEAGFGEFFSHGLGHGIGLEVHEAPSLRPNSETVLEPGMVTTVEPGVYLPGWGGVRLEDDLLVTPDGCEVLTNAPKDLRLLICDF